MIGYFFYPIIAPARQNLDPASVEPGVHAVSVELDLVQPVRAIRCFLHELGELRFDPRRWRSEFSSGWFKAHSFQVRKLTNDGESLRVAKLDSHRLLACSVSITGSIVTLSTGRRS